MVGSKHLFTVFTQSWNIFSLLSREWKYLTRQSKIKSWTAPSCLLARRCAWLKKIIPLIFRNNTFPAAAIIYDVACLFTPGLMMSCFEAIFVLLHYFDTLRPTSWAGLEKQRLDVLGNSSWLTSRCLQQSGTVLPRGASNFSPDLRPQLGVTFRYSRRTIDQLANRKIKFLQKVGLDFPLLSGVVWVYCAIYWNQMIYLHVWPFLNYLDKICVWITEKKHGQILVDSLFNHSYLCCVVVWFVCLVGHKASVRVDLHVVKPAGQTNREHLLSFFFVGQLEICFPLSQIVDIGGDNIDIVDDDMDEHLLFLFFTVDIWRQPCICFWMYNCIFICICKIDDILAVLVLHGVVDVPPALQSKLVSQLRPPVSPLHHRLHLHNTDKPSQGCCYKRIGSDGIGSLGRVGYRTPYGAW